MVDDSGDVRSDTNFNWHGYHLSAISGNGLGGLDIDTPARARATRPAPNATSEPTAPRSPATARCPPNAAW